MTLSEEALNNKPKRPLNAYFKFRGQKLNEFKDNEDKNDKAKALWKTLDEKTKKQMEDEYHEELEQYKKDIEAWKKKYSVSDEDMKRKSKKKKEDTDDEEKKPAKTKGTKESKNAPKEEPKKEEPKRGKTPDTDKGKSKKEEPKKNKK